MARALTADEWAKAFEALKSAKMPKDQYEYYLRTFAFLRDGRSYSRADFTRARAMKATNG